MEWISSGFGTHRVGGRAATVAVLAPLCLTGCATFGHSYPEGDTLRDCEVCPELVVVPLGKFVMGSPATESGHQDYEGPQREVEIHSPVAVGVYEVTFAEWDACVAAGACGGLTPGDEGWGRAGRPVVNVSWSDVQEYLRWLSDETGSEYRLLSEAEWEYVARAGSSTARYWGEPASDQCQFANGGDGEAPCPDGYPQTAPVGSFEPNAFGLFDALGNVWEWTQDCWEDSYPSEPGGADARLSGDCTKRVVRGGSWFNGPMPLRSASRGWYPVDSRERVVGFRVARPFP